MQQHMDHRSAILSQCTGLDPARASRLLELMPALGRVPTDILLAMAGLEAPHGHAGYMPPATPAQASKAACRAAKAAEIRRILSVAYNLARRDPGTRLGLLLRRLGGAHPDSWARLCLAAVLRHCNDALHHSSCASK